MMLKTRNSNIELLRIVCMLMILIQHADFWLMGYPEVHTARAFGACAIESISIIAVNVFILISGYFGVKFKGIKILNLLFQCVWAVVPMSLLFLCIGKAENRSLYELFFPFNYWFVTAYIGLIILSPVLNAYIEKIGRRQLAMTIFLMVLAAFVFDMVCREVEGFAFLGGYSTIWMVCLYFIGRYLRLYPIKRISKRGAFGVFMFYVVLQSVLLFFHLIGTRYTNPILLIGSVAFFLFFTQLKFSSKVVNWISSSALMVYLFSMHPLVIKEFGHYIHLYDSMFSLPVFLLCTSLLIVTIYTIATIYDKIRMLVWRFVEPLCYKCVMILYGLFNCIDSKIEKTC